MNRFILAGAVLVLLGLVLLSGWTTWRSSERVVEAARARTQTLARLLDQHAVRTIDGVDMLLRAAAKELGSDPTDPARQSEATALLAELARSQPYVRSVEILDGDTGEALFAFAQGRDMDHDITTDAPALRRPEEGVGLTIGQPVPDGAGGWIVSVSRRVGGRDGVPGRLVVARVSLDYFQRFFEEADLGQLGAVVLFRADGVLLARRPYEASNIGRNLSGATLFREQLGRGPVGTYEAAAAIDGIYRIISYRRLEGLPLILVVSLAKDEVLAGWRQDALRDFAVVLAAALVLLVLGVILSRTSARRAQAEATLRATLDNMDQGLIMVDAADVVQLCNRRALDLLDLPAAFMAGKPSFAALREFQLQNNEFARSDESLRDPNANRTIARAEHVYERERPNGTVLEIRTVPLPGGGAVRTYTDVTARRAAEAAVRESEIRHRLLADYATDMVVWADLDTTRRYVSPASRELLGFEPGELVGTRPLEGVHPDDVPAYERRLTALTQGRTERVTSQQRYRRKDGAYIWTEAMFRLLRDGGTGQPTGYVAAVRDISDRKAAEAALAKAKDDAEAARAEAEQASQAKTDFLASMSHEIRTPLNGVLGYADVLLDDETLSFEQRHGLERIQSAGAALLTVVNDILDFSKIEAGQIELDLRPFALDALVDNAISIVGGIAQAKGLSLRVEVDDRVPQHLVGDENRLRQILLNLLNNAVKFTPAGSVTLSVEREESRPDALRFAITDTGIGIAPEKRARLFQRFSQVDGSIRRDFGGTGLGLAISKRLVELMGGTIGVESNPGRGSTFWFTATMPQATGDFLPRAAQAEARPAARPASILLAEDLAINQEIASVMLRAAGHRVDVVGDGAEAVAAVRRKAYDLILMDIQMPGMDGITATRHIRELEPERRRVPVVALTANVLPGQVAEFRQAGLDDHMGKPFKREELLAMVERWTAPRDDADPQAGPADAIEGEEAIPPFDRAPFDDLLQTVGPDQARLWLDRLRDQIETVLLSADPDRLSDAELARSAHAFVSQAGMLGFLALSDQCSALEEACRQGTDERERLLHAVVVSAREACQVIDRLQASLGVDTSVS